MVPFYHTRLIIVEYFSTLATDLILRFSSVSCLILFLNKKTSTANTLMDKQLQYKHIANISTMWFVRSAK